MYGQRLSVGAFAAIMPGSPTLSTDPIMRSSSRLRRAHAVPHPLVAFSERQR